MSRWTKYQTQYLIRKRYNKVRQEESLKGLDSLARFVGVVAVICLISEFFTAILILGGLSLTGFIISKIIKHRQKKKMGYSSQQENHHGNYTGQTQEPPPMTGQDFERYCAILLQYNGYVNVQLTKASGDNGVDILAERDGIRHAIQVKYYTGTVGNDAVQQVHAGRAMYQCAVGIVMTNSTFTQSAKDTAVKLGIVLWDGDMLSEMATRARAARQPPPHQQHHAYSPPPQ